MFGQTYAGVSFRVGHREIDQQRGWFCMPGFDHDDLL